MVERKHIEYQKIQKSSKELNLLIVEDVMEDLALIVNTLKSNGVKFTYNVAGSKLNYQRLLKDNVYDAILSDYYLADFDIFELLTLLQKLGQEVPVILITDCLQEEEAFECLKAGVDNYIFKDKLLSLSIILERAIAEFRTKKEQQRAIIKLQQQAQQEAIINRIVQGMRKTLLLDEVMQNTVEQLHEVLQVSHCIIVRLDYQKNINLCHFNNTTVECENQVSFCYDVHQYYSELLARGEQVKISKFDTTIDSEVKNLIDEFQVISVLITPLLYQDTYQGGIILGQCDQKREWTEDELSLLKSIADHCAIAIHQAELYQQAQIEIAERKQVEEHLRKSQERYALAIEASHVGIWEWELQTNAIYVDPILKAMLGYEDWEVRNIMDDWHQLVHPEDREQVMAAKNAHLAGLTPKYEIEHRMQHKDGSYRWFFCCGVVIQNEKGITNKMMGTNTDITQYKHAEETVIASQQQLVAMMTLIRNITECKQAQQALRNNEVRFRALIENANDLILIIDAEGISRYISPSLIRVLGYIPEKTVGQGIFDLIHIDDLSLITHTFNKAIENPGISQPPIEYRVKHSNGYWCFFEGVVTNLLHDPAVEGIIVNSHDITQRKRIEEQLKHDALHDPLTHLPNRTLFMDRLEQTIKYAERRNNFSFAVLFIDIDRFKVINDSFGHSMGNQLIIAIAELLKALLSGGDTVARLGADEFVILLEYISGISDATCIANRIHKQLTSPIILEGNEVFITASIGIALNSTNIGSAEKILRDAEIAMQSAKNMGRGCYQIFCTSMHTQILKRLKLENNLQSALKNDLSQFVLNYQPIVSLSTNNITGFEALVRWQHPQLGLIYPAEFIPVAEETGLIIHLGLWVLREACRQLRQWQNEFPNNYLLKMSVNLSVKQFAQADLIEQIDQILLETQLDGSNLKLEITESALIENYEFVTEKMSQLRGRNIELCIDDFGTGYSSLSYLHRFPMSTLKIDRSFVNRIGVANMISEGSIDPTEIIRSIITLSHNLGINVVAEGVETTEQVLQLQALKCEYGQGYLFSKPLDIAKATSLISTINYAEK
ncbi:MAG: EAL domain-containing protein [Okeania sp. SIO2G4]|uniref:EAL domain-containing protein n=1 Tax=unclassified Okeania TaxID=2634635 RepID=UPI0013BBCB8E|nr:MULTISPECIES: EAL domain-containing protein [unclassified Okeania]NEP75134.1 EAL domain-containing protein [Okeania sp. SIO2G5]NEP96194.1 EAL domain-containing protein [Okeania sp. SIO2F5]NEQ93282.1 EAL domain-containing protein [Okeania sp. SIO2G4]